MENNSQNNSTPPGCIYKRAANLAKHIQPARTRQIARNEVSHQPMFHFFFLPAIQLQAGVVEKKIKPNISNS